MRVLKVVLLLLFHSVVLNAEKKEWIDLGLPSGTKWAVCNIGAECAEEVGNYYAWGETGVKREYRPRNYRYYGTPLVRSKKDSIMHGGIRPLHIKIKKYILCEMVENGGSDNKAVNKMVLEDEDDAAYVLLGPEWRMPTKQDYDELILYCNLDTISINGTKCIKLTSTMSGYEDKYICFPASGYRLDRNYDLRHWMKNPNRRKVRHDNLFYYWTATFSTTIKSNSQSAFSFQCDQIFNLSTKRMARYIGAPIRAVYCGK